MENITIHGYLKFRRAKKYRWPLLAMTHKLLQMSIIIAKVLVLFSKMDLGEPIHLCANEDFKTSV